MNHMRIETERLLLRPIDPDRDFEAWARTMADAEVMRFVGGQVFDRALAWRNMVMVIGHWAVRGYGFFSVEERETGTWVGRVGPWYPEGWPEPEIGWTIARDHWGKGYATEAARSALDFVFDELGWQRVIHVIIKDNEASIAVAEKLGSKLETTQQGLPGVTDEEVLIYGQQRQRSPG